ncbi:MAG: hypothetical protein PHO02_01500 [Candidatus Nanoarchaeia archaeon]|nr:hypothetical protein [Candidatus Nanoarchaeia archaeon]
METLKIILIAAFAVFLYLLLKTRLWRRIPVVSTVFSVALLIAGIALALFFGSILLFAILGVVGILIILFIVFWIFGRAKFFRISKGSFRINAKEPVKKSQKPKVKVIK